MGIYNVHAGHCPDGYGACGACGYLRESTEARIVKDRLIFRLRQYGNTVYDCTDDTNCSEGQNLYNIVSKCNAHSVNLDMSIHLNAGGGNGVEVWCYDSGTYSIASKICSQISKELGIPNRGVKYSQGLYVLSNTVAPAILIECCFVDSVNDTKAWNACRCGEAIATAITGKSVNPKPTPKPTPKPQAKPTKPTPKPQSNWIGWIAELQSECNAQGFSKQMVDGIAGPNTLNGCPMIGYGAQGNITKIMQSRVGTTADGIFGNNTLNAVKNFQKSHGLDADGIVGRNTWTKILGL